MLPYSLNPCLAFLPCSGPRINLFLSHRQTLEPINREMNACMNEQMGEREKWIALYYNSGNHIVISFIYGELGVIFLYKYICV